MVKSTDYSLSLMDMLCAAMGGVALMVFLFAAMRKNLEQQAAPGSVSACILTIKHGDDEIIDNNYLIGKEISFGFFDEEQPEKACYLGENVKSQTFSIVPGSYPNPSRYAFSLVDCPDQIKMRIWLKEMPKNGETPTRSIKYCLQKDGIELDCGELTPDSGYIGISKDSFGLE